MIVRFAEYKQKKFMEKIQEQKYISKNYIKYIKKQPCIVCGSMPCDPDHLEARGMGGANRDGYKDYSCVPLCRIHHTERHQIGNKRFEDKYILNLWYDAFNLLRRYFIKNV